MVILYHWTKNIPPTQSERSLRYNILVAWHSFVCRHSSALLYWRYRPHLNPIFGRNILRYVYMQCVTAIVYRYQCTNCIYQWQCVPSWILPRRCLWRWLSIHHLCIVHWGTQLYVPKRALSRRNMWSLGRKEIHAHAKTGPQALLRPVHSNPSAWAAVAEQAWHTSVWPIQPRPHGQRARCRRSPSVRRAAPHYPQRLWQCHRQQHSHRQHPRYFKNNSYRDGLDFDEMILLSVLIYNMLNMGDELCLRYA